MIRDIIEQIVMVTGRIIHQGTGNPIAGKIAITSSDGEIIQTLRSDGFFAISGKPGVLFQQLATMNYTLHLAIRATSSQYRAGVAEKLITVPINAGENFNPPLSVGTILFAADTSYIRGRVTSGVDPHNPIAGATVKLIQSMVVTHSTTSDANGAFTFDMVPVAAPAELECSAATFVTQKRALIIDYGRPVHEEYFRLTPS